MILVACHRLQVLVFRVKGLGLWVLVRPAALNSNTTNVTNVTNARTSMILVACHRLQVPKMIIWNRIRG